MEASRQRRVPLLNRGMQPAGKLNQIGVAWNWHYDGDFVHLLDKSFHQTGLDSYLVGLHNLAQTTAEVERGERQFLWFLDRASDEDAQFLKLNQLFHAKGTHILNAHDHYLHASDKAEIHRDLLASGLNLPTTLIVPAYDREPQLNPSAIDAFAKPFVVKPAKGSGGRGVLTSARHISEINHARAKHHGQRFLIQQKIEPQIISERRAWFRVYFVCGTVIPCWWDDRTHRYVIFEPKDADIINVAELERILRVIASISKLDFFSAEIALDTHHRYVVIDYVNTPCDMRLQSKHANGVPDLLVHQIIAAITGYLKVQITGAT